MRAQVCPSQCSLDNLKKFQMSEIADITSSGVADQIVIVVLWGSLFVLFLSDAGWGGRGFLSIVNNRHNRLEIAQTAFLAGMIPAIRCVFPGTTLVAFLNQKLGFDH